MNRGNSWPEHYVVWLVRSHQIADARKHWQAMIRGREHLVDFGRSQLREIMAESLLMSSLRTSQRK